MPLHDWTRVEANTFHDFHGRWITHLTEALNLGLLPPDFYAQSEQHLGRKIGDVLTLHASDPNFLRTPPVPAQGTMALAERPPQVQQTQTLPRPGIRQRTLTVRHTTGHRIIALAEVISPGNKATAKGVSDLVQKVEQALAAGIHVALLDLLPPGPHDPNGIHGAVVVALGEAIADEAASSQLTFVSYAAEVGETIAYLEHPVVGEPLPELPLFLASGHYINLPLEATYEAVIHGMGAFWRDVLEGKRGLPT